MAMGKINRKNKAGLVGTLLDNGIPGCFMYLRDGDNPVDGKEDIFADEVRYKTSFMTRNDIPDPQSMICDFEEIEDYDHYDDHESFIMRCDSFEADKYENFRARGSYCDEMGVELTQEQEKAASDFETRVIELTVDSIQGALIMLKDGASTQSSCESASMSPVLASYDSHSKGSPVYNLGQQRSNDLRRVHQHRTISANKYFDQNDQVTDQFLGRGAGFGA